MSGANVLKTYFYIPVATLTHKLNNRRKAAQKSDASVNYMWTDLTLKSGEILCSGYFRQFEN